MSNATGLTDYYNDLMNELDHQASSEGNYKEIIYIEKILPYMQEQGVVDEIDPYYFYKPRYGRIDGIGFNGGYDDIGIDELELIIVVNDFIHSSSIQTITNTRINQLKNSGIRFFNNALDENFVASLEESSDGYAAAQEIIKNYNKISSIKLIILTNAQISARVSNKKEKHDELDLPFTLDIWDIKRIYDLETSKSRSESIEIELEDWGGAIPALLATKTDDLTSYLCVANGETIADLYDEFGSRLLEANVRSFLQFRGKVNKGIRKTINTEPELFFSYNNGLTATASDVVFDKNTQTISKINNLQIVNGGQTTASLLLIRKKDKADLKKINVQIKLNVVCEEKYDELISNISRYANSQNAIQDSDFFSNHPFHRELEEVSRRVWAPPSEDNIKQTRWYYERARGSYLNEQSKLTPAAKKAFQSEHPKSQLITKTDLAKVYLMFDGRPHDSIKGAQIAFKAFAESIEKEWGKSSEYVNDYLFQEIVSKFIIWIACKKTIYSHNEFVGNTKATITAYTVHVIYSILNGCSLDFNYPKIWKEQAVNQFYNNQFLDTAIKINDLLNKLSSESGKAVLSMAKSKETLNKIQEYILEKNYFDLTVNFKRQLVDKQVIKDKRSDFTKRFKKIDKSVKSLNELCSVPTNKWNDLIKHSVTNELITNNDAEILSVIPRLMLGLSKKNPTDRQIEKINQILGHLENHGIYLNQAY